MFVHAVYFWLHDNLEAHERAAFVEGLKSLTSIETIKQAYTGVPAGTDREIIDRSYSYALIVAFADPAGHDAYQTHPTHDKFRENCARFWKKVQIYDSISENEA